MIQRMPAHLRILRGGKPGQTAVKGRQNTGRPGASGPASTPLAETRLEVRTTVLTVCLVQGFCTLLAVRAIKTGRA